MAQGCHKARRNAVRNPHAHLKIPDITIEQVLESDMLAYPVRKLDFCPDASARRRYLTIVATYRRGPSSNGTAPIATITGSITSAFK